jgi:hypothetical protein
MVNVGLIFRIKLILTIFGMDQQPDFLLGLPASSLNFQTASESRFSWCSVLYLWRGKFNPNQLCNAMQLTTSYIFRSAPPSPWLYSYSESSMHLVVCAANECCISKTTALRVVAEGHRLNNSFLSLTQATMLRQVGCHLIWNLWIKVTDSSVISFTAFWVTGTKYDH